MRQCIVESVDFFTAALAIHGAATIGATANKRVRAVAVGATRVREARAWF